MVVTPVPDLVKPSFVIFDIRALWRSGPGEIILTIYSTVLLGVWRTDGIDGQYRAVRSCACRRAIKSVEREHGYRIRLQSWRSVPWTWRSLRRGHWTNHSHSPPASHATHIAYITYEYTMKQKTLSLITKTKLGYCNHFHILPRNALCIELTLLLQWCLYVTLSCDDHICWTTLIISRFNVSKWFI